MRLPFKIVLMDDMKGNNIIKIYQRVIERCIVQRHEGIVAICCNVFFSSAKKINASEHSITIPTKEFRKKNGVVSLEELNRYFRENTFDVEPQLNNPKCSSKLKSQQEEIVNLKLKIAELEHDLVAKQTLIDSFPVA